AARYQIKAEEFAVRLGVAQQYRDAIEHKTGWLSGDLPRYSEVERRLINGRAYCPRGCKSKKGTGVLRRQCKQREDMYGLVSNEMMRRYEARRFIETFKVDGFRCCRTMENCPFEDRKQARGHA